MVRCRTVVVVILLALWLAIPVLACLPSSDMTSAEMACCKKMAGNCNMGTGQHPCCKTVSSAPDSIASLQRVSPIFPDLSVGPRAVIVRLASAPIVDTEHIGVGFPPPAPPGQNSILRI